MSGVKKKGFVMLPVILAAFIVGLIGVGLTSIYSGTFSTLAAGKAASQAQQIADVESNYIKLRGYDDVAGSVHDWKDTTDILGSEDGAKWQSKIEDTGRDDTSEDGKPVKVMKVSVRKTGEIISRYSQEIPLVQGLDVYSKDEIDNMFNVVDKQVSQLANNVNDIAKSIDIINQNIDNMNNNINQMQSEINNIDKSISAIQNNLDTLEKMIQANSTKISQNSAQIEQVKKSVNNLSQNLNNEKAAREAAVSAINTQISSIKGSLTDLNSKISSLNSQLNTESNERKAAITKLSNDVQTKYAELKNLYNGLKGRLDGNEFVKSKDNANNIALKYEQKDGESAKSLHAYVDGVEVPLASQGSDGKDGNIIQEKATTLKIYVNLKTSNLPSWNGLIDTDYFTSTTGNVTAELSDCIIAYSNGPYAKIELASLSTPLGSTTTTLGTSIKTSNHQYDACKQQAIDYVNQHIDDFKSKIAQKIPEASQATKIIVDAGV